MTEEGHSINLYLQDIIVLGCSELNAIIHIPERIVDGADIQLPLRGALPAEIDHSLPERRHQVEDVGGNALTIGLLCQDSRQGSRQRKRQAEYLDEVLHVVNTIVRYANITLSGRFFVLL